MYSQRLIDAFSLAAELHAKQLRKGTYIPYLAHLMGVASIALEHGADEDQAIAALLHDAVEDQGGEPVLAQIRERFGARVAAIVDACTDARVTPKPDWRTRKETYIRHLPEAGADARLVSAADKLYNARAILFDYRALGEELWSRFTGGKAGTLWYYRAMADTFLAYGPVPLGDELNRVVCELEGLVASRTR
jgi:(p)ppGpp synthase/HD superfamily hydrolase